MDTGDTNNAGEVNVVVEQSSSDFDLFFNEPYRGMVLTMSLLQILMGAVEEVEIM